MFWKKEEEPIPERSEMDNNFSMKDEDFSKPIGMEEDLEPMGLEHEAPGIPNKPSIQIRPLKAPMETGGFDRDTELILAKLDAVKAKIESIDARLAHIEKLAEE